MRSKFFYSCFGNLFEHYDTALSSFLTPLLAPLLFPHQDPVVALILAYGLQPVGMLARPLGSYVFGYIGDHYGRGTALFGSLCGMAFVSLLLACSPTYAQVGWFAPLLFCVHRALQNFFVAGETMGGAIFLLEQTPEKKQDVWSGWYGASAMGGHLFAASGIFILHYYAWTENGWRLLYLLGCATALFGCLIRRAAPCPSPLQELPPKNTTDFNNYTQAFFPLLVCSGFAKATYGASVVVMQGLLPLISSVSAAEAAAMNTYLLCVDFALFPLFGWTASLFSRQKQMLGSCLSIVLLSGPLFHLLAGASFWLVFAIRIIFIALGVAFCAPFYAWAQQLVPAEHRYQFLSLGESLGNQILGGPTAALAIGCFHTTGSSFSAAWYWMALGIATCFSLVVYPFKVNLRLRMLSSP